MISESSDDEESCDCPSLVCDSCSDWESSDGGNTHGPWMDGFRDNDEDLARPPRSRSRSREGPAAVLPYHEAQEKAFCGRSCVNAVLGEQAYESLEGVAVECEEFEARLGRPHLPGDSPHRNADGSGNYSVMVVQRALGNVGFDCDVLSHPKFTGFHCDELSRRLIVHRGRHWYAVVRHSDMMWYTVDSLRRGPVVADMRLLDKLPRQSVYVVRRHRCTGGAGERWEDSFFDGSADSGDVRILGDLGGLRCFGG